MAVQTVSSYSTVLAKLFDRQFWNQVNRSTELLSRLRKSSPLTGETVNWTANSKVQVGANHVEGADITSGEFLSDTLLPMSLGYGCVTAAFGMTDKSIQITKTLGSSAAVIRAFQKQMEDANAAICYKLNQELFTGTGGSNQMTGLDYALLVSGSYAGQTVTGTELASNVETNGGVARPISIALMEDIFAKIDVRCGARPNLIVCHPYVMTKYKSLFEPLMRFAPGDRYSTSVSNANVYFQGDVPVVTDHQCATSKMYFLNTNTIEMVYLQPEITGAATQFQVIQGFGQDSTAAQQVYYPVNLPIKYKELATQGDSTKMMAIVNTQLKVMQPNANAILADLAV